MPVPTAQELEARLSAAGLRDCFLCNPAPELVYASSHNFFAMLGIGPIGLGYSLVASKDHVPSMLDLEASCVDELGCFMQDVRRRLLPSFGELTATEHGRVAVCVASAAARHEPHCLHAHRLLFPGVGALDLNVVTPGLRAASYASFSDAHRTWFDPAQYLYSEGSDGACQAATIRRPLPRQFFRGVVASQRGTPELADWRRHPNLADISRALEVLDT